MSIAKRKKIWEMLKSIMGKFWSIIDSGLVLAHPVDCTSSGPILKARHCCLSSTFLRVRGHNFDGVFITYVRIGADLRGTKRVAPPKYDFAHPAWCWLIILVYGRSLFSCNSRKHLTGQLLCPLYLAQHP